MSELATYQSISVIFYLIISVQCYGYYLRRIKTKYKDALDAAIRDTGGFAVEGAVISTAALLIASIWPASILIGYVLSILEGKND